MSYWSKIMEGRNGIDNFNMVLLALVLVCNLLSKVFLSPIFSVVSLFVLTFALFRTFSKRLDTRKKEEERFMGLVNKIKALISRK